MLAEVFSSFYTWTFLILLASAYTFNIRRRTPFPVINAHPFDLFNTKAHRDYASNAHRLIADGLTKHRGPVALSIPSGRKIVLPSSCSNWVKSNKDLDHRELVRQDFYAGLPGFEAQTALHSSGDMLLDIIRAKLGQNDSVMPVLNASVSKALHIHWGESTDWHTIDWQADTTGIIARAASSTFVGPEKADDEEWLQLVQSYVAAYFSAVGELHTYPAWTRPIVQRFLPNANACRKYTAQARSIIDRVIEEREEAVRKAQAAGKEIPQYNDALAWTQAVSDGKLEAGDIQLSLAMAAFFTTSELFRQVLIDVASHPEVMEPLRKEVSEQLFKHGTTVAATYNMFLLDSAMKESQRLSAVSAVLERVALKSLTLPTTPAHTIPAGTHIMVDSTSLWDQTQYPDPYAFDPYRFLRKREAGDKFSQFAQSGPDFSVFGGGRHLCPGRFFASNEIKLVMAHILEKYDIKLADGYTSRPMDMGVYKIVDPMVRFEVRRRVGE